jgi:adenylate kinase family enzyme
MKLMIFGPPGSGKGTYSSRLQPVLNVKRIATGDIYRDEMKKNTELGKKAAVYYNKGELVPDAITIDMLKGKLDEIGKKNFILDGFPRTVEQAKALEKIVKLDALILIVAPEEILIEKAKARRICSNTKCDGNYNLADIHKTIKDEETGKDIDMFDLIKVALRQRPRVIIVGEVRGKEAYTLFQAMTTGHLSYSTVHASDMHTLIQRLENKPIDLPRALLTSLDVIVFLNSVTVDGAPVRRITNVTEVIKLDPGTNRLVTITPYTWISEINDHFLHTMVVE